MWDRFQDGLTRLFYSHGLAIVKMIRSALSEEKWTPDKGRVEIPIDEFADHVASIFKIETMREEIGQAIKDMFFERDNEAFHWLTQVCGLLCCSRKGLGVTTVVFMVRLDHGRVGDQEAIFGRFS